MLGEFTSALNSKTEEELLKNVAPTLSGKTVIIIATASRRGRSRTGLLCSVPEAFSKSAATTS